MKKDTKIIRRPTVNWAKVDSTKVEYLIGVPPQYIENFDTHHKGVNVMIRKLCALRTLLMYSFAEINVAFKQTPLREMKETQRLLEDLDDMDIVIDQASSLSRVIIQINQIINEKVSLIAGTFKQIPEEWVKDLFNMPKGNTVEGVTAARRHFTKFHQYFPYQRYINWDFAATPDEDRTQNILKDDATLLELLSQKHSNKSSVLFDFIGRNQTTVVVDCENSDAQRLYSSLYPIAPAIRKIILVDDSHTNPMWDELAKDFTSMGIDVEHDELKRLKEQKSLVDFRVVAKTCEEHFKYGANHFVLATSDSDIWALIQSLPEAQIVVLAEKCKSGDALVEALTQSGVTCLFMEDIAEDSFELMDRVLLQQIKDNIQSQYIDMQRAIINAAQKTGMFLQKEAITRYVEMLLEDVTMKVDAERGTISVAIADDE